MKWDLASKLLILCICGWDIGVVPAMIDGTVSVNKLMHNTQWVPSHFHTHLLLGEFAVAFDFAGWRVRHTSREKQTSLDRFASQAYAAGGAGFILMFL